MSEIIELSIIFLILMWFGIYLINSDCPEKQIYDSAIAECEKSLPRDKHCKIVGVVAE